MVSHAESHSADKWSSSMKQYKQKKRSYFIITSYRWKNKDDKQAEMINMHIICHLCLIALSTLSIKKTLTNQSKYNKRHLVANT